MKTLLIYGGSGSLGETLIETYKDLYNIVIYSRDENKHWLLRQKFKNVTFILGDIRDKNAVETSIFKVKPNTVIIASALKHIDQCENNINECIYTNIIGVQNIVDIVYNNALKNQIDFLEKVLFVSTDKACSPVNAYGMCKSLSERMIIEKSQYIAKPKFMVVRYGNVISSRGSLFPLFHEIGKAYDKTHFTITDDRMTRFFMTLKQSVKLIDNALMEGETGDTYIPQVKSYLIRDIAEMFSKKYNKPIIKTGLRPGEKLHETLINITESYRTVSIGDNYVVKPCYRNDIVSNVKYDEFSSDLEISDANEVFINSVVNPENKEQFTVLITSVCDTPNIPFSYISTRSVFSRTQRFEQLKNTITSIKYKIPHCEIILSEYSSFSDEENIFLKSHCAVVLNPERTEELNKLYFSPQKALGEYTGTKLALEYISKHKPTTLLKISGRYIFSDSFNFSNYDNDFINCYSLPDLQVNTVVYKIPSRLLDKFYEYFKTTLPSDSYEGFIGNFIHKNSESVIFLKKLGVEGYVSVTGEIYRN